MPRLSYRWGCRRAPPNVAVLVLCQLGARVIPRCGDYQTCRPLPLNDGRRSPYCPRRQWISIQVYPPTRATS